ncbi:3-hydroxyacyl-CoA dehydrogenase NAD-binding domain-containing protein [uncultured Cohaesibacter sp.]|uniref:3-hydroxyacyl-CoA dehydrogenase NAD-binding domain-containing protein n=1 Tax=uncultured Cohaesibacter sp. TaxID=1002546 RepID=UPI002AA7E4B3|nr:3-hydroxyacyl-CoA dehydrogenase NAD-binding domain-containing protein [uncultured Cohaesibacter sp.]
MDARNTSVVSLHHDGDIAMVTVNNPPVNALSLALRQELLDAVEACEANGAVRAVVLICEGRTFIAGADVREFGKPPQPPHLPDVVARIEGAQKPWIAAIHGAALGGGFEVAMGCRFRIAVADAKVGLPEVTLGIVPGASGTVRTARLAGVACAVELVTSGRPWNADKALAAGLIDDIVVGDLKEEALAFARTALESPLPPVASERPVEPMPEAFWQEAKRVASKVGYQAPLKALELIRLGSELPFSEAMIKERETFLMLRQSDEAAALRHVFFAEKAAGRPAALRSVEPRPVATVGVVGGGTMGAGIVAALRQAGLPVVLIERDQIALERGMNTLSALFDGAVKRGKLDAKGKAERMGGVTGSVEYGALSNCDLVIEAVFEEISVKRAVFAELAHHCRPDAILATNTSYLDPREIVLGLPNPDRFIGLHFFSPAHVMKLLEIVPVPETAQEVLAAAFALARRLGKMPVKAGICEGFIGNRILKRYRAEAEALIMDGVPIADIDKAMRGFGFRMGPFEAQDLGGLDIAFLQREGARSKGNEVPETLGDILVKAGRKGQKTGGGWYDYRDGDRTAYPSDAVKQLLKGRIGAEKTRPLDTISNHLIAAMADEGQAILDEGIAAQPSDIDLVEIHGYGFPRWKGGPMFWAERMG